MAKIELIATAAFGLEAVVARELKQLGYGEQTVENGKVTFVGDEEAICRTNLWLRSAERVLVKVGQFKAVTFEELFQRTKALPWPQWMAADARFPVEGKSINSKLHSVPDCQAIVKKAIVEKMKEKYKIDWFEEKGPLYTIEVALLKDIATLTIDTSGSGLHKRGYRKLSNKAPIKETLAAAMISLAHWFPDRVLMDPMCGSGTIPIEAALIGLNIAPGLDRDFAAASWPTIAPSLWKKCRVEAKSAIEYNRELRIIGTDIDEEVLSLARYHAREAGVEEQIHFQRQPVSNIKTRYKYGYLICNPPYGERLGEQRETEQLYKEMGQVFKTLDTWSYYVITSHPQFERLFGRQADKKRKLYNGRIQCNYFQFFGPRPPRNQIKDSEADSDNEVSANKELVLEKA